MSALAVMNLAASGMKASTVWTQTIASNLSNANNPASSKEAVYQARYPIFETTFDDAVAVNDVFKTQNQSRIEYKPDHPMADEKGYVYFPKMDTASHLTDMIASSKSYEINTAVFHTAKQTLLKTMDLLS